ncbi:MAG: hypothetical protein ACLQBB_03890 [Solirubrobacteraceae bacterium]
MSRLDSRVHGEVTRISRAWEAMDTDRHLALVGALGLFVSMFLPWYQQNAVVTSLKASPLQSRNLNAFQVFSFVEAAVLLVAVALLYMLYARAEGRTFTMPGGDGTVVFAAGVWTALLLIFRLFDKPGISSHGVAGNVGVQWGIFFALAAAGLIAYAGSRMRHAEHGQPPTPRRRSRPPERDGPSDPGPASEPERADPETQDTLLVPTSPAARRSGPAPGRTRYPPAPPEQLSFEDPPRRQD